MGSEEPVCPVCGQPVENVVKRHKTLGAWVPVWGPGPCRNRGCGAYTAPDGPGTVRPAEPVPGPAPGPGPSAGARDDAGRAPGRPEAP
ncbi:hypothetical protein [Streptomyces sp. NPDC002343]